MTLLEATSTLIDCAKTYGNPSDRILNSAINRMEKRLAVLQLRAAKSLSRRRHKGWKDLQFLVPTCPFCQTTFIFGDFAKSAELNRKGDVIRFDCPDCSKCVLFLMIDGKCETYLIGCQINGRNSLAPAPNSPASA